MPDDQPAAVPDENEFAPSQREGSTDQEAATIDAKKAQLLALEAGRIPADLDESLFTPDELVDAASRGVAFNLNERDYWKSRDLIDRFLVKDRDLDHLQEARRIATYLSMSEGRTVDEIRFMLCQSLTKREY